MCVLLYCGVCTGVRLLPPGENPIAVRNNNNNNIIIIIMNRIFLSAFVASYIECKNMHGMSDIKNGNKYLEVTKQRNFLTS
jgi:hypothetical protein